MYKRVQILPQIGQINSGSCKAGAENPQGSGRSGCNSSRGKRRAWDGEKTARRRRWRGGCGSAVGKGMAAETPLLRLFTLLSYLFTHCVERGKQVPWTCLAHWTPWGLREKSTCSFSVCSLFSRDSTISISVPRRMMVSTWTTKLTSNLILLKNLPPWLCAAFNCFPFYDLKTDLRNEWVSEIELSSNLCCSSSMIYRSGWPKLTCHWVLGSVHKWLSLVLWWTHMAGLSQLLGILFP